MAEKLLALIAAFFMGTFVTYNLMGKAVKTAVRYSPKTRRELRRVLDEAEEAAEDRL